MSDYLAKPIEERLHNLLLRYKRQRYFLSRRDAKSTEIVGEPECDPRLATGTTPGSRKNRFSARDMLQMLLDFALKFRNKVEEQLVGENPEGLI